jgi:hypothetical protein
MRFQVIDDGSGLIVRYVNPLERPEQCNPHVGIPRLGSKSAEGT